MFIESVMTKKQEIDNEINRLRERVQVLELERAQLPEGYMSKLRKYVKNRVPVRVPWKWEVVDSFHDRTCGVLFKFYVGTDNGHTIRRSPRFELIRDNIFRGPEYSIIATYATPEGLVLEVREN